MATTEVTAPRAVFNGIPASPETSETPDARDGFSKLLTVLAVAAAQQRHREAAEHDAARRRKADRAWTAVLVAVDKLLDTLSPSEEDRAFAAFAMVIARLAETRGTPRGRAFLAELMDNPEPLIGLFRHADGERSGRLMAAGFNQIDRLGGLAAFASRDAAAAPETEAA